MFFQNAHKDTSQPGDMLLEHECEDTKTLGHGGGLLWTEGAKPGAF